MTATCETLTKWVNMVLSRGNFPSLTDLVEEMRDGITLIRIVHVLSGEKIPRHRKKCRFRAHKMDNTEVGMRMLHRADVDTKVIHNEQLVDGERKMTLGLIWLIFQHFPAQR